MYRRIFGIILGVLSVSRHKNRNVLRISQKNQGFIAIMMDFVGELSKRNEVAHDVVGDHEGVFGEAEVMGLLDESAGA